MDLGKYSWDARTLLELELINPQDRWTDGTRTWIGRELWISSDWIIVPDDDDDDDDDGEEKILLGVMKTMSQGINCTAQSSYTCFAHGTKMMETCQIKIFA